MPNCLACAFDAQAGLLAPVASRPSAIPKARVIKRSQWVELCGRKSRPEIVAGTAHRSGDRTAPLHHGQGVDGSIGPRRSTRLVGDGSLKAFDRPMIAPLSRGRDGIFGRAGGRVARRSLVGHQESEQNREHSAHKELCTACSSLPQKSARRPTGLRCPASADHPRECFYFTQAANLLGRPAGDMAKRMMLPAIG